ncbi:hypothetical protein GCM10010435_73240 [Winogradskya consettensis]|uniref:N-acetyltransferase domain-containing protein n=1 Tax=Winogradskya consettensis TaxID=113560 RepID=A0A919SPC9_9ACTN|nr:GNAT family N-acetyltransferase [Actinoplanes consettensis]GIM75231.1 hypothetical protein Aco04nite_44340 [Actinoplanes consettensis]
MTADLMAGWARGWAVSRGAPAPVPRAGGWFIPTGVPGEAARYLLHDSADVPRVTGTEVQPHTWIKVSAAPDDVLPHLPAGWERRHDGHLMHRRLGDSPSAPLTEGYTARLDDTGTGAVKVVIRESDGEVAAKAQAGIAAPIVVFDRVETLPAHQRRGLGRAAMTLLTTHVATRASAGILVATDEGRALYETLGWITASPVTVIEYVP